MTKKVIKAVAIAIGSLIALILAAMILVPVFFKDALVEKAISLANDNLRAKVELSPKDFRLTLFKNFPDFTLEVKNLKVEGVEEFEGVTLAGIERFYVVLDLSSVFSGAPQVKEISLDSPEINLIVKSNGAANYDIVKESSDPSSEDRPEEESSSAGGFRIGLDRYAIRNARVAYADSTAGMYARIEELNHSGSGDFSAEKFLLKTSTEIGSVNFGMGGIPYLKDAAIGADLYFDVDLGEGIYRIETNGEPFNFRLNDIALLFEGQAALRGDDMDLDFRFGAAKTSFKSLLSMIPEEYMKDFDKVDASSEFSFSGYVKGLLNEQTYPSLGLSLEVADGRIRYPSLPGSIDDVRILARVEMPQSPAANQFDDLRVDVPDFSLKFAGNRLAARLKLLTPVSDPDFDLKVDADVDLSKVSQVIPMEKDDRLSGRITADVALKGRMSMVEKNQYDRFTASGQMQVVGMNYTSKDFPQGVDIRKLLLVFTPRAAELKAFDANIGQSDVHLSGSLKNYIGYLFSDGVLEGGLSVSSSLIDLNSLMPSDSLPAKQEENQEESDSMEPLSIPSKIRFDMQLDLKKVLYGQLAMTDLKGGLGLYDQIAYLRDLKVNLLDGGAVLSGWYNAADPKNGKADVKLSLSGIDLNRTAATFASVNRIAPAIAGISGTVGGKLSLSTSFDSQMSPVFSTLNSNGVLQTSRISLQNNGFVRELADKLQIKELQGTPTMDPLNISYTITDGVLKVSPIGMGIGNIKGSLKGNVDIAASSMNMDADMSMPFTSLGGDVNRLLEEGVAAASKAGVKVTLPETFTLSARITGSPQDPSYKLLYGPEKYDNLNDFIKAEAGKLASQAASKAVDNVKTEAAKALNKLFGTEKKDTTSSSAAEPDASSQQESEPKKNNVESLLKGLFGK